ncbi:type I toxin-antitoxin system ptaRNA1 family toxin [Vibrio cholerae]|nr:type I toxin-antitoxin system ptaRNA1 family toxin [Vibrio cholerae]
MTITHNIEVQQAIHQAAIRLAVLELIDQDPVANMFTILAFL